MSYGSTYATRARQTHTAPSMSPASFKQAAAVAKMRNLKVVNNVVGAWLTEWDNGSQTAWNASRILSYLMDADTPWRPRETTPAPAKGPAPTEPGMYRTPAGELYRVQAARTGERRLYAKLLVITPRTEWVDDGTADGAEVPVVSELTGKQINDASFEFVRGAIFRLTADMLLTVEQAQEIGRHFAICIRCGAVLEDPTSIERGQGPTCYGKA